MKIKKNMYQDEAGVWWWQDPKNPKRRGRCKQATCAHCGGAFWLLPTHSTNQGRYRFCSRKCAAMAISLTRPVQKGPQNNHWKGGRRMQRGYVLVYAPDHHSIVGRGTTRKYVLEHRLVMEEVLGRPLMSTERVHHKNGDGTDNRPENLERWTLGHPAGQRIEEAPHCPTCTCFHHRE